MRTKYFITVLLVFGMSSAALAQTNGAAFGIFGGASWWKANGDLTNTPGATFGFEIDYVGRAALSSNTELGAKLGLAIGFASASHQLTNYTEQYTNQDYYPENLDYTITADTYKQKQKQWQLMVPVMLSLKTHGVVLNVGAKMMYLLTQNRQLDVTNAHINVYYPDFDVPTIDYLATGRLPGFKDHQSGTGNMPKLSVLLAGEIGYEWTLSNASYIGLVAYVDYSVWNNYSNTPAGHRLIDVAPILNKEYPVPDIKVNYLTDTYADKVNYLSVGVRFYYLLSSKSTKQKHSSYPCRCIIN